MKYPQNWELDTTKGIELTKLWSEKNEISMEKMLI